MAKASLGTSEKGGLKQSRLYDSHYILSKQEQELDRRIERQKEQMLNSYIVQKDPDTLIVS